MTNLEIIKYLTLNNPSRLAEFLNDIYWAGRLYHHAYAMGQSPTKEFDDFEKWLNDDAKKSSVWYKDEFKEWSKAINNPSIEITYPDNLVIEIPYEGKDPNHMWNTDNNFNILTPYMQAMLNGERYDDTVKIHFEGENNK